MKTSVPIKKNPKIAELKKRVVCPVELSLRMFGGKWRGSILYQLKDGPLGFNELKYRVQDAVVYDEEETEHFLSSKVLSEHLVALQEVGLVEKSQHVMGSKYFLTSRGESAVPLLIDLFYWGEKLY